MTCHSRTYIHIYIHEYVYICIYFCDTRSTYNKYVRYVASRDVNVTWAQWSVNEWLEVSPLRFSTFNANICTFPDLLFFLLTFPSLTLIQFFSFFFIKERQVPSSQLRIQIRHMAFVWKLSRPIAMVSTKSCFLRFLEQTSNPILIEIGNWFEFSCV